MDQADGLTEIERRLIEAGSTDALRATYGDQIASDAMHSLSLRCPEEIRSVWYMVIAWGRFQLAFESARKVGDFNSMMKIVDRQIDLVGRLYK